MATVGLLWFSIESKVKPFGSARWRYFSGAMFSVVVCARAAEKIPSVALAKVTRIKKRKKVVGFMYGSRSPTANSFLVQFDMSILNDGPMEKIGFVGVGRMGANMARRLKDQGATIAAVYDVNHTAAEALAFELRPPACQELRQVTKLSDVIITVVTDDKAMKKIFGENGLLAWAQGRLFINCAT